jgi:hypothetical protein
MTDSELTSLREWERASRALPRGATTTVEVAARTLGISRHCAYQAVNARLAGDVDAFPVQPIRVGHRILIPVLPLIAAAGVDRNHDPPKA